MKFSKVSDKKAQEFRHIYMYSILNVTSAAFIAPIPKSSYFDQVRYQQRHNLQAYMKYMYSILSLQCIIGRFSTVLVFGCFRSVERLKFVAVFWSIFLEIKAKQDQSGSFFSV